MSYITQDRLRAFVRLDCTVDELYEDADEYQFEDCYLTWDDIEKLVRNLKEKDPILKDFKAVKEGNCYVTGTSMYQRTDLSGEMIMDFHKLVAKDGADMKFISKLE